MNHKYTLSAGRLILRDGNPFVTIGRAGGTAPTEVDSVAHIVTHLLNEIGDFEANAAVARAADHWHQDWQQD